MASFSDVSSSTGHVPSDMADGFDPERSPRYAIES
jgi:hypothetical protein